MQQSQETLKSFQHTAFDTVAEYMRTSAWKSEMPHEFEATCQIMQPSGSISPRAQTTLKATLNSVIDQPSSTIKALDWHVHQIDIIVGRILSVLEGEDRDSFEDDQVGRAVVKYVAPRIGGEGLNRAVGHSNPPRLGSLLTKYLVHGPGNLTQNTLYSIWVLCVSTPQLAVFDEETLAAVCAAPLFSISPSVIAVLKLTIVTTAADFSQEELGALMDRLQIPSPISATFTASDVVERWNQAPFIILIEFLEHDASLPEPWAKNRTIDNFQFLAQRCTRQNVSRSLQHRFATWFRTIIDDPSLYSHAVSKIRQVQQKKIIRVRALESRHHFCAFIFLQQVNQDNKPPSKMSFH
jgi:hypothetical protein